MPYQLQQFKSDGITRVGYWNGKRFVHHNIGAPAKTYLSSGCKVSVYMRHGKLHRTDGPAVIYESQYERIESVYVRGKDRGTTVTEVVEMGFE